MAAKIPGRLTKLKAALYVPSSLLFAATDGLSLRHLMTGAIATIVRTTPSKKAFEVDLGRVPLEPATMDAAIGPSM